MKFIIPQNYNFKSKIFGIIDYSTAIINIIWYVIVLFLLNLIFKNLEVKIILFISLCFPLLLFSIVGFNGENIFYIITYIIKYLVRPKLYLYRKI